MSIIRNKKNKRQVINTRRHNKSVNIYNLKWKIGIPCEIGNGLGEVHVEKREKLLILFHCDLMCLIVRCINGITCGSGYNRLLWWVTVELVCSTLLWCALFYSSAITVITLRPMIFLLVNGGWMALFWVKSHLVVVSVAKLGWWWVSDPDSEFDHFWLLQAYKIRLRKANNIYFKVQDFKVKKWFYQRFNRNNVINNRILIIK